MSNVTSDPFDLTDLYVIISEYGPWSYNGLKASFTCKIVLYVLFTNAFFWNSTKSVMQDDEVLKESSLSPRVGEINVRLQDQYNEGCCWKCPYHFTIFVNFMKQNT